jgi:hypothetical protein
MAAKETKEKTEVYTVRPGMVLHKERINSRGQLVADVFDGDDPDNNLVELLPSEVSKYLHQLEGIEATIDSPQPDPPAPPPGK